MKKYYDENRTYYPKKVKHVHFISNSMLVGLEHDINAFADENSSYKILGIKLTFAEGLYIATITYLCNAEVNEAVDYNDDFFCDEED